MLKRGLPRGHVDVEMSWILEDNDKMNTVIKMMGARIYEMYRVFEKKLT